MLISSRRDNILLQFLLLVAIIPSIYAIKEYIGDIVSGRILWLLLLVITFLFSNKYKIPQISKIYISAIIWGYFLHYIYGIEEHFNNAVLARVVPIILLSVAYKQKNKPSVFILFSLFFYILECGISIYEKINMSYLIQYKTLDEFNALNNLISDNNEFRSVSLMLHPLYNANTVSIFLIFILFSDTLKKWGKYTLIIIGLLALWAFNSRAAMIIWFIILTYKLFFYNTKHIKFLISLVVLYFIIPIVIDYVITSGIFGRLTDMTSLDDSSLTRITAFDIFFNERWTFDDIVIGGRLLYYPGTDITLENGVLLDLGYWGLIIGSIKVLCEIIITYKIVIKYKFMDRILIILAIWGVAFMNNNSFQTWIIPIFTMANITFNNYMPYQNHLNR